MLLNIGYSLMFKHSHGYFMDYCFYRDEQQKEKKMNNRILSMLLVTLFITSAVMAVPTASAHFTLGDQTTNGPGGSMGGLPWAPINSFGRYSKSDNHSAGIGYQTGDGHLAYVTPGSLYMPISEQQNYYSPKVIWYSISTYLTFMGLLQVKTLQNGA